MWDDTINTEALCDYLSCLICPPHSMTHDDVYCLPVDFGSTAESMLLAAGAVVEDAWLILQIYVHAQSPKAFTHYVRLQLGWPTHQALVLWDAMHI
ncbi:hypothetical protein NUW54_g163 [Trametes sanguinea]|uniref:Uncharacterized protein n=1 Tax=Trametes sanguinea TaxID=158606 RepID=A0ACC1QCY5_9APHY|nr:hypothetical protein NUW54_g163 [Trametes sanguinea]